MLQTLMIHETLVSQFKFWWKGQIRRGMMFRSELFCYVSQFSREQRHQAFDLAGTLCESDRHAIVTTEHQHYTVWVSLRSLEPETDADDVDSPANSRETQAA